MKRLYRILLNAATLLSLLLCLAAAALWLRGNWRRDVVVLRPSIELSGRGPTEPLPDGWVSDPPAFTDRYRVREVRLTAGGGAIMILTHSGNDDEPTPSVPNRATWNSDGDVAQARAISMYFFKFIIRQGSGIPLPGLRILNFSMAAIQYHALVVRDSLAVLLMALLPACRFIAFLRGRRLQKNTGFPSCRQCGYHLRATPERCPECGCATQAAPCRAREAERKNDQLSAWPSRSDSLM